MTHTVDLDNTFRGPLDLLLYLVRRDEIGIHDIPIARVTGEYIAMISGMPVADLDQAADFLALAAYLTEIKSRGLLPPPDRPGEDAEDEAEAADPRSGLVAMLREYLRFKEAAAALADLARRHALRVPRPGGLSQPPPANGEKEEKSENDPPPPPGRHLTDELLFAIQKFLLRARHAAPDTIVYDQVPTEVRLRLIETALENEPSLRFSKLLSSRPTPHEVVGWFIAILELIRQQKAWARQTDDFTDILLERRDRAAAAASEWNLEGGRARRFAAPAFLPVPPPAPPAPISAGCVGFRRSLAPLPGAPAAPAASAVSAVSAVSATPHPGKPPGRAGFRQSHAPLFAALPVSRPRGSFSIWR